MAGSTVFQPGRSFALRGRLVIRPSGQGKALGGLTAQDTSTIVLGRQQQNGSEAEPAFVGALDGLTTNMVGAWSVARRLLASYSGPLIRVRRGSDSAELDAGYAEDGSLDSGSLLAFVGAGNGHVTTVYNQLSDGVDLAQSTAALQPGIVDGGSLIVNSAGKPTLKSGGGSFNGLMEVVFDTPITWPFSVYSNDSISVDGSYRVLWALADIGRWFGKTNTNTYYAQGGVSGSVVSGGSVDTTAYVFAAASGADKFVLNGSLEAGTYGAGTSGNTASGLRLFDIYGGGAAWGSATAAELVLYNAEHSTPTLTAISAALTFA